jgi:hypothetical protein
MERGAGGRHPGGGVGRGGLLGVAVMAGGRAAARALGSASLRVDAVVVAGRPPGSDLFASKMGGGGRAVTDAGGARVEGATIDTA